MRPCPRVLLCCLLAMASPLAAQVVPVDVVAALADRQHDGGYRMGPFVVTTPYARVVELKRAADRTLRPVTPADIPPDLLAPRLIVWARPHVTGATAFGRPGVDSPVRIVLRPKGSKDAAAALQPLDVQTIPEAYGNALGGQWPAQTIAAAFPLETVRAGQWEIVGIFQSGRTKTAALKLAGKP